MVKKTTRQIQGGVAPKRAFHGRIHKKVTVNAPTIE
jgi:hypothetical protein